VGIDSDLAICRFEEPLVFSGECRVRAGHTPYSPTNQPGTTLWGAAVFFGNAVEVPATNAYPGIGVEREWNNKDPFFDRDLSNFAALHREGVVALGVIVPRPRPSGLASIPHRWW